MKKIAGAIISIGLILSLSGCHWEIPETISVKSDAEYNFSLGTFEKEFDNDMDIGSMMGGAGENNNKIATLDYFPGKLDKNTQHFLLQVECLDATLISAEDASPYTGSSAPDEIDVTSISTITPPEDKKVGMEFNPSSLLSGMKDAFGSDVNGKIEFAKVPMYFYCEATEGVKAKATITMFYGDKSNPVNVRTGTEITVFDDEEISNKPLPVFAKEGDTVITNLASTQYLGSAPIDIKALVNNSSDTIQDDDQLYISYHIVNFSGTVRKEDVKNNGITMKLYAVIDLPMMFKVSDTEDLKLDLSEMTKSDGSSGSDPSTPSSGDESSKSSDFEKYLQIIDTLKVKYIAYKLPFYATSGMKLGIDLIGDGKFEYSSLSVVDKNKTITEDDKGLITLPYTTVQKLKDTSSFTPNIQILMSKSSVFSIPREKAIEMNIELSLKTDGVVQVK